MPTQEQTRLNRHELTCPVCHYFMGEVHVTEGSSLRLRCTNRHWSLFAFANGMYTVAASTRQTPVAKTADLK